MSDQPAVESEDINKHFATVWVKVEVEENDSVEDGDPFNEDAQEGQDNENEDTNPPLPPVSITIKPPERKKPKRPPPKKVHKCLYCDYETVYKSCLKYHIMDHTNFRPVQCDRCDYTTKYRNLLQRHTLMHQYKDNTLPPGTVMLHCSECPYTTLFKQDFKNHKRRHSLVKNYTCDKCSFSSAYLNCYKKHMRVHEERGPDQFYQCDKCSFKTKYKGHIVRHLAQIHKEVSEKAFTCDHCQFTSILRWRLNIHLKRNRQAEPIKCQYCDLVTDYYCAYKLHLWKHPGVKKSNRSRRLPAPLPEGCSIPFHDDSNVPPPPTKTKDNYTVDADSVEIDWGSIEVLVNAGQDKPFQCVNCEFKAKFKASVQRHFQRQHTSSEMRPYRCIHCNFTTKTKDSILIHIKNSVSKLLLRCNSCSFCTYFKCQHVVHQHMHRP